MDSTKVNFNYLRLRTLFLSTVSSILSIIVGGSVIIGWLLNLDFLTKVRSDWAPMVFNTAICFVLAGLALWMIQIKVDLDKKTRGLASIFALGFGILALLSGAQYFIGIDFGIDNLLYRHRLIHTHGYVSGRMALNTSICFVLLSLSIMLAESKKTLAALCSQLLALSVGLISLIALVGYLYGSFRFYGVEGYSSMAIHSATLFFLLAFGCVFARPGYGATRFIKRDPVTAKVGINFLMAILLAPILFGWLWFQGHKRNFYSLEFGISLLVISNLVYLGVIVWLFIDKLCLVSSQRNSALQSLNEMNLSLEDKIKSRTESLEKMINLLQSSNDRFNSVMSTASDAIVCANKKGEIVLWNYAAEEMFGYKIKEIANQPLAILIPQRFYEAHVKAFVKAVSSVSSTTFKRPTELIAVKKDGSEFPIEFSLSSWNANGQKYFTGVIRDITSRKDAERKIAEQQKSMVQLSRMQAFGQLAGGLAHEINTPLGVIYLQVPRVQSDILENRTEKAVSGLSSIESMAQRISGIVNRLMQFSQESQDTNPSIVNINDLVDQALGFCHEKLRNENIDLKVESTDSILTVKCRGTDLTQAILNLLLNSFDAVKGTRNPWIHVKLGRRGNSVEVSVTDSGSGIPVELQERIMEPFFTTKDVGAGMGLGLSVTKGIVESHKGQIILDRESPNTKFILEVPYEEGDENAF